MPCGYRCRGRAAHPQGKFTTGGKHAMRFATSAKNERGTRENDDELGRDGPALGDYQLTKPLQELTNRRQ